jgi:hypothetical protein
MAEIDPAELLRNLVQIIAEMDQWTAEFEGIKEKLNAGKVADEEAERVDELGSEVDALRKRAVKAFEHYGHLKKKGRTSPRLDEACQVVVDRFAITEDDVIRQYSFGVDIDRDRRTIEAMSGGRQVILKFKKGGRIPQDFVYDSASDNREGFLAIISTLTFAMLKNDDSPGGFGSQMIGKGYYGVAPWQIGLMRQIVEQDQKPTPEQFLEFQTALRVADVIEQPRTVIIEVESV